MDVLARFKRLFRLRFAVLYPLGAYLAFFTAPDDASMRLGIVFMVIGMAVRLWSNGYAIKLDKLTISGPYAHVRNPLYLGTGTILLGVVVMLQILWVGLAAFVMLALVYARTIRNEQQMLAKKFGAAYAAYCAHVPAVWPTLWPYRTGEKWPFSWQRVWESREHKVVLWMAIVVIAFHIKQEIMVEGEGADIRIVGFIVLACFLGLVDLVGEYCRHCQKKGGHDGCV